MSIRRLFPAICLAALLSALAACSGPFVAPRSPPAEASASAYGTHTVQRGDTLYSLARRYGQTVGNLMAWNQLRPPYTLYPGQVLRVAPSQDAVAAPPAQASSPQEPLRRVYPGTIQRKSATALSPDCPPPAFAWQWPTAGVKAESVLSTTGRAGLDIFGSLGQPVYAAADGQVIYSGPGMNGSRHLIILRHDATYLSIYAYIRARYVSEGEYVRQGRTIGEMGSNHEDRAMLHFEISCRDKAVDPLWYLPR